MNITVDAIRRERPPTQACLVCGCKENPTSDIVFTDKAWLCDKCRAALLKVVEETEKGGE